MKLRPSSGTGSSSRIATCAIILFNTLLLFAVANVAAYVMLDLHAPHQVGIERAAQALRTYGIEFFRRLHPGKSDTEVRQIVLDQSSVATEYAPFVESVTQAIVNPSVNVHAAGFRSVGQEQGPWPPDSKALTVFVFGASTVFGAGLWDDETIPAQVQKMLRQRSNHQNLNVYNFGTPSHFSTQEVIYLQNMLRDGEVPDMAIFIDGASDMIFWHGDSANSGYLRDADALIRSQIAELRRDKGFGWHFVEMMKSLPTAKLAAKWRARGGAANVPALLANPSDVPADAAGLYESLYHDQPAVTDPNRIAAIIGRYLANKAISEGVARQFGFEPVFIWQPVPTYEYDLRLHPFRLQDDNRRAHYGYPTMARYVAQHDLGTNFLWCANVFADAREGMYVDQAHYSAAGNTILANCIADGVMRSGALARALQRKMEEPVAQAAQRFTLPRSPRATAQVIATLSGSAAQSDQLTLSDGLNDPARLAQEGVRLANDRWPSASIFWDTARNGLPSARTYTTSVRLRAGSSRAVRLSLHFFGPKPLSTTATADPHTMKITSSDGLATIEPAGDDWYRLSLSAESPSDGITGVRVQLYPCYGTAGPVDPGDVVFGGGSLDLQAPAVDQAALPTEQGQR